MNKLSMDDIRQIAKAAVATARPAEIPAWLWDRPYANEPYYRFLFMLARRLEPEVVVELGTDTGTSALFLQAAVPNATVITIDINVDALNNVKKVADEHELSLITCLGPSTNPSIIQGASDFGKIDLLFIDTIHTFEQASAELKAYTPLLAEGAIVTHDDIALDEGMLAYWANVPEPKENLPELHYTGFGVSIHSAKQ